MLLHSGALTIVPTFKGVGLYGATFLHVGTMVNAAILFVCVKILKVC